MNTNLRISMLGAYLLLLASAPAAAAPGWPHTLVVPAASYFSFSYGTRPGYGYGHHYRAPEPRYRGYYDRNRHGHRSHGKHDYHGHHNYRGHHGFREHGGFRDYDRSGRGNADRHHGGYQHRRQYLGNGARGYGAPRSSYHHRQR